MVSGSCLFEGVVVLRDDLMRSFVRDSFVVGKRSHLPRMCVVEFHILRLDLGAVDGARGNEHLLRVHGRVDEDAAGTDGLCVSLL